MLLLSHCCFLPVFSNMLSCTLAPIACFTSVSHPIRTFSLTMLFFFLISQPLAAHLPQNKAPILAVSCSALIVSPTPNLSYLSDLVSP